MTSFVVIAEPNPQDVAELRAKEGCSHPPSDVQETPGRCSSGGVGVANSGDNG
jgi:hypothetical protein